MQDVVYVAVMVAFFAVSALFVVGCDRIIGSDEDALAQTRPALDEHESAEVAA
jgi:hypothetical protein